MIHDKARVDSIRTGMTLQIQLVSSLEAKIKKGNLPQLQLARYQLGDIDTFFLAQLDNEQRTPREESMWLDCAEHMLQIWISELKKLEVQFKDFGPGQAEIIDG